MTKGRLFLTNHRILLLSAEEYQGRSRVRSYKKTKQALTLGRLQILALQDEDGEVITDRNGIISRVEHFYQDLYSSSKIPVEGPHLVSTSDPNIPPINADEVKSALKDMKKGKAPGEDEILTDVLKEGGEVVISKLADLFTRCIRKGRIPDIGVMPLSL
ncbi:uncharacterized protein [Amphiura filiformis]|uniref:uncharacterized protein n=1 Tax=Amphiura filiformis TaxID=82378 RepID=UPI003B226D2E